MSNIWGDVKKKKKTNKQTKKELEKQLNKKIIIIIKEKKLQKGQNFE